MASRKKLNKMENKMETQEIKELNKEFETNEIIDYAKDIKLIYMKSKDIKVLKERIWKQQNKICPILGIEIPLDKAVLDHKHKLKSELPGPNKGTIRTFLDFRANALAGKMENAFKRYFGSDESKHPISLPEFLRNTADYLENGDYVETYDNTDIYYIHPNEVPKRIKVKKSQQNKINKYYLELYPRRKKIPKFTYMNDEVQRIMEDIKDLEIDKALAKAERQRKSKKGKEN
jgi:hypothetical protein